MTRSLKKPALPFPKPNGDADMEITERLRAEIASRTKGLSGKTVDTDLLLEDALYAIKKRDMALKMAAERFEDLGSIVAKSGGYDNAGFLRASARRCRELDF